MPVDRQKVRSALAAFEFKTLFIESLGWDHFDARLPSIAIDSHAFTLTAVAEKRGLPIVVCSPNASGEIPDRATRNKLEQQFRKQYREHLIIFIDRNKTTQIWQWTKQDPGQPIRRREQTFQPTIREESLLQRLGELHFPIELEEDLTLSDVLTQARAAFDRNADTVTKKFYERFQKEQRVFQDFIEGIGDGEHQRWYASVMLNRLMFVYFIQKKGFLDGDTDYLGNRLKRVQQHKGPGKFHSFYRSFLLRLFHDALGKGHEAPDVQQLIGKVPYLNGGLFDVHQMEREYDSIDIADEAFEKIFDFFDTYNWHLDDRPITKGDEINPAVLGHIFEKYVNQKQMGAYYTKEDITDYIGKNTIIPFLFDAARKKDEVAFAPDGAVWRRLQDNPDFYIYDAVRKGTDKTLPAHIAAGINDVHQRSAWNRPADEEFGLPTEIWREHMARRTRYEELFNKLVDGEITEINDLITHNLDIRQFAVDVIADAESPDLVRAFWKAITSITVLDPTCGSGAFLFAALNILVPLYEACLDRMQEFCEAADTAVPPAHSARFKDFREVLAAIEKHPNRHYYVLKSIILNNLYGVDIMEEAVEICKLRLFLKLVSQLQDVNQIEPLPDIDFNIRPGNTLVGFARLSEARAAIGRKLDFDGVAATVETQAQAVAAIAREFRRQQETLGGRVTPEDKLELRERLDVLEETLNRYLAAEYGIDQANRPRDYRQKYDEWREIHQPFHWFVDFYDIIEERGGFSVIIGNPPYVSKRKVDYQLPPSHRPSYPDLYADITSRSVMLLEPTRGSIGLIVPLSLTFSEDFSGLRNEVAKFGATWLSSYDILPSPLFGGAAQRCTIWVGRRTNQQAVLVSRLNRWRSVYRPFLFETLKYFPVGIRNVGSFGFPRHNSESSANMLSFIQSSAISKGPIIARSGNTSVGFAKAALNFVPAFLEDPPYLRSSDLAPVASNRSSRICFDEPLFAQASFAILIGETYLWYWLVRGDGFDVTKWVIADVIEAIKALPDKSVDLLARLGNVLHQRRFEALVYKNHAGFYVGNFNFQPLFNLTRRGDLLYMLGLGASLKQAVEILNTIQRTLAVNVLAGEKGIPENVKNYMRPLPIDLDSEQELLASIDQYLCTTYGASQPYLEFLYQDGLSLQQVRATAGKFVDDDDKLLG